MADNKNQPVCKTDPYGDKRWYLNGKLHREDGPAAEFSNGDREWWLNDVYYTSFAVWYHYLMECKKRLNEQEA